MTAAALAGLTESVLGQFSHVQFSHVLFLGQVMTTSPVDEKAQFVQQMAVYPCKGKKGGKRRNTKKNEKMQ